MVLLNAASAFDATAFARHALEIYLANRYGEFAALCEALPEARAATVLNAVVGFYGKEFGERDVARAVRRMGMNAKFRRCLTELPYMFPQALFFVNDGNLATRVNMSFWDHPSVKDLEVDYTLRLVDQSGARVYERDATILPRQTHSFDVSEILREAGSAARYGTFYLLTASEHLASLRAYATWHNGKGMTTTHEKGALSNGSDILVYPKILCDDRLETYLVVASLCDEKNSFICHLADASGNVHSKKLSLALGPRSAAMLPVSKYFPQCREFLAGRPGVAYLRPEIPGRAMYYYFIHDREKGTWQIQHT